MIHKFLLIFVSWIVMILYLRIKNKQLVADFKWPILLILAGTLANGFEVLITGQVFDYFDLTKIGIPWPVFNLSDTAIVIGLVWLIYKIIKIK